MRLPGLFEDPGWSRGRPPDAHGLFPLLLTAKLNSTYMPTRRLDNPDYIHFGLLGPDRDSHYRRTELELTKSNDHAVNYRLDDRLKSHTITAKLYSTYMPARSDNMLHSLTVPRQTDMDELSYRASKQQLEQPLKRLSVIDATKINSASAKQTTKDCQSTHRTEEVTILIYNNIDRCLCIQDASTLYTMSEGLTALILISCTCCVLSLFCTELIIRYILKQYMLSALMNIMQLNIYQCITANEVLPTKTIPGSGHLRGTPAKKNPQAELNPPPTGGACADAGLPRAHGYITTFSILNCTCKNSMKNYTCIAHRNQFVHHTIEKKGDYAIESILAETSGTSLQELNFLLSKYYVRSVSDKHSDTGTGNAELTSLNTTKSWNRTISGRRPLHRASLSSNGDDEDDDKEIKPSASKIKSRCEQDAEENQPDINAILYPEEDYEPKSGPPAVKKENNELIRYAQNSTRIEIFSDKPDTAPVASINDLSLLGGISRIWGVAKNVTFFGVPRKISCPNQPTSSHTDLSFSLICEDNHDLSLNLSCANPSPPPSQNEEVYENQPFYTPPRPRSSSRNNRSILGITHSPRRSRGTAYRSRSMSECTSVEPYYVPPANILRQRLKDKIQATHETPLSRRRSVSESVVTELTDNSSCDDPSYPTNTPTTVMCGCTMINESGVYDCSTGKGYLIRLDNEVLDKYQYDLTYIGLSKSNIVSAIDQVISNDVLISPKPLSPLNHTMEMVWDPLFEPIENLPGVSAQCPRNTLHALLSVLNKHTSLKTDTNIKFNALRIISMPDRSLKRRIASTNPELPLLVLHLGQERSVDLIPLTFDLQLLETFDVRLGNFSLLTVLPETLAKMKINLSSERALEDDERDFHIIIVPFSEKTPTSIRPELPNPDIREAENAPTERIAIKKETKNRTAEKSKEARNGASDKKCETETGKEGISQSDKISNEIMYKAGDGAGDGVRMDLVMEQETEHEMALVMEQEADRLKEQRIDQGMDLPIEQGMGQVREHGMNLLMEQEMAPVMKPKTILVVGQVVDQVMEQGMDPVMKQGLDQVIEQGMDPVIQQGMDQVMVQGLDLVMEQSMDQVMEQGIDQLTVAVHGIGLVMDQGMDQMMEQGGDPVIETGNVSGDLAGSGSGDGTGEGPADGAVDDPGNGTGNGSHDGPENISLNGAGDRFGGGTGNTEGGKRVCHIYENGTGEKLEGNSNKKYEAGADLQDAKDDTVNSAKHMKNGLDEDKPNCSEDITFQKSTSSLFVDHKLCVGIINSNNNEIVSKWLQACNIDPQANVHENRALLLDFIQEISAGKKSPSATFLTSILKQLLTEALNEELLHLNISHNSDKLSAAEKRQLLLEHIMKAHSTGISENNGKIPDLLTEEEGFSESESNEESSDSDPEYLPTSPPANKSYAKKPLESIPAKVKNKVIPLKQKSPPKSTRNNQDIPVKDFEIPIKTLQDSILRLQEKMKGYDEALEIVYKNQGSTLQVPQLPDNSKMLKRIEKLEKNNKILFEHFNSQHTTIDTILERLQTHQKSEKRLNDRVNAIKDKTCEHNESNDEFYLEIRDEILKLKSSNTNLVTKVDNLNQEFGTVKSNNEQSDTSTISSLTIMKKFDSLEDQFAELSDTTNLRLKNIEENTERARLTSDCLCVIAARHSSIATDHSYTKSPNKEQYDMKNVPALDNNTSTAEIFSERAPQVVSGNDLIIGENVTINDEYTTFPSNNTGRPRQEHEIAPEQQNMAEEFAVNVTVVGRDQLQKTPNEPQFQPEKHHENNMKSNKNSTNTPLSNSPMANNRSNLANHNTVDNERTSSQPTLHRRFQTHKCFLIHDPYMNDFSPESFSKWFDMTCCKTRTLKALLQDGTLVTRIRSQAPETVFIHLGQGDLWDKTEGGIIVDYFKQIVWKILENTSTKVCLSLIIPINGLPQMNSVIKQVNTSVANFVSDVRRDPKYKDRVFTSNNNSLSGYIMSFKGNNGEGPLLKLNVRGQKIFWLRLKDSLNRSLNLALPQRRQSNSTVNKYLPRNSMNYEH